MPETSTVYISQLSLPDPASVMGVVHVVCKYSKRKKKTQSIHKTIHLYSIPRGSFSCRKAGCQTGSQPRCNVMPLANNYVPPRFSRLALSRQAVSGKADAGCRQAETRRLRRETTQNHSFVKAQPLYLHLSSMRLPVTTRNC
jgi:hypothetical protein